MGIQTGTAMMLESGDCIVTISVKDRKGNEVFTADREVYYNSFIYSAYRTFDFQGNMTKEYRESRLLAEGTTQATSVGADVRKGEPMYTVSAHMYRHSHCGKQNEPSSENWRQNYQHMT